MVENIHHESCHVDGEKGFILGVPCYEIPFWSMVSDSDMALHANAHACIDDSSFDATDAPLSRPFDLL
jgi:hypothetical protein